MDTKKLKELYKLLKEFRNCDYFGLGEMEEMEKVEEVISLVDGAIINLEDSNIIL